MNHGVKLVALNVGVVDREAGDNRARLVKNLDLRGPTRAGIQVELELLAVKPQQRGG